MDWNKEMKRWKKCMKYVDLYPCYFHLGSFPLRHNSHIVHAQLVKMFYLGGGGWGRARVAQWWEHSPPTNMDQVQIPSSILLIIWWMKNHYVVRMVPLNPEFELARFYCIYLFICLFFLFTLTFLLQIMSIEDVEKIMDETQEGVEYQRVCIIISMQENNHVLQGADTEDELQQDLCKNHSVSHPIFFIYCQKLKVTSISVQRVTTHYMKSIIICYNTLPYIKTGKYFNSREKRRKK